MMLATLLLVPVIFAILSRIFHHHVRILAITGASLTALGSLLSLRWFDASASGLQMEEHFLLFANEYLSVAWHIGIDGLSYPLFLLTAILGLVGVLVSQREISFREKNYYPVLLLTIAAIMAVFVLQDMVLFFVAWEAVLLLLFFMILLWGGSNRQYAAMKFLLYTGLGSGALLFSLVILIASTGISDITAIASVILDPTVAHWAFGLLLLACLIKLPIVPLHTWLPDAHVQAPTAGSILLAGVMLKMGGYALIRIGTAILPDLGSTMRILLFGIATMTILWGGFACLGQRHLKRLIAYSSVMHMGFVLLAIAAGTNDAFRAATIEMVSHGLLSGLLFALAGAIHHRTGTYDLAELSGLASRMPITAWLLVIAGLGTMGLPGMTGFIAEVAVFFSALPVFGLLVALPLLGILLGGAYITKMITSVAFGPVQVHGSESTVKFTPFVIILALTILLGIMPNILFFLTATLPTGLSW